MPQGLIAPFLSRCSFTLPLRRPQLSVYPSLKDFSTSSALQAKKKNVERRTVPLLEEDPEDLWDQLEYQPEVEDTPSSGHLLLQQQRQLLHYMRLIEHEMPKLVAFRKKFIPPDDSTPLIVRCMHYQGEAHPAILKRVVVVPLDKLPLKNYKAIHKFKLLAGTRWFQRPPANSGVGSHEEWGNGFIQISCEDFQIPSMNLKWSIDTLEKLIAEANNEAGSFEDIPVDTRHSVAKSRKAKKGDHLRGRLYQYPSIRDFPKEWLPPSSSLTSV